MSAIITKIVKKYNLNNEMSVSELSKYTSEFLENLTDNRKRNQGRRHLREGFKFSSDQGSCKIAIASPPKDLEEEIIREITKRILQNRYGFSEDQEDSESDPDEGEDEDEDAVSFKNLFFLLALDGVQFLRETSGFAIKSIIFSPISGFTISSNW
ncbi:7950_t:CDS:2 [Dentiscutata heterogama]|uniref:7950_t:CDS:1 n=1 Tax=Dentiscutata heterogama TaxID=1316150 RepID=A0ACA9MHY7_9GLOM|nr:7950_t:CDS:2 [Dentiscutata heterogama]